MYLKHLKKDLQCDLLRVGFDAPLGDDEPQEHASGHPEDTLLGIELDAFFLETPECHFKVGEEVGSLPPILWQGRNVIFCGIGIYYIYFLSSTKIKNYCFDIASGCG